MSVEVNAQKYTCHLRPKLETLGNDFGGTGHYEDVRQTKRLFPLEGLVKGKRIETLFV